MSEENHKIEQSFYNPRKSDEGVVNVDSSFGKGSEYQSNSLRRIDLGQVERKKGRFSQARSSKEDQAHITSEAEQTSPGERKPVPNLKKDKCMARGNQFGSEKNHLVDQAYTLSIIIDNPDNKNAKSPRRI
ncbi:hypothetical protein TNCV_3422451 [Trichonephila clavipes]|nr:hypothetical protein TNCV_3422451 [Trichonephila clavipes]